MCHFKLQNKLGVVFLLTVYTLIHFCDSVQESQFESKYLGEVPGSDLVPGKSKNGGEGNLSTLELVQVVFRHGDRSPVTFYPTDPYKDVDTYWPMGLGQLTETGMEQHYELGSYFRHRYDGFISPQYSQKQIHVLSSDMDRTIMSAEANAVGLFPTVNRTRNSNSDSGFRDVGIQLVPVHTLPKDVDKLLKMTAPCPRKEAALEEFYASSPKYAQLLSENTAFIEFLQEKLGLDKNLSMFKTLKFHDALICQKAHNLTLPAWANDTVMDRMRSIRGIEFELKSGTTELKRLSGGPLVERLVNNMLSYKVQSSDGSLEDKLRELQMHKMFVHSAHDDTIAAVMASMEVFDPQIPSYASAFIVELHREPDQGEYFVKFFFRNSSTVPAYPLQIPGCEISCPLPKLVMLLEPVIPKDWDAECQSRVPLLQKSRKLPQSIFVSISDSDSHPALTNLTYLSYLGLFGVGISVFALVIYLVDSLTKFKEVEHLRPMSIPTRDAYVRIN